mgnify:CR=1 FL=1
MYYYDKDELFKWLSLLLLIATGVAALMIYFYQHQEFFIILSAEKKVNYEVQNSELIGRDWKTYKNDEYGFQLMLTDEWKNYRVLKDSRDSNGVYYLEFEVPTLDKNYRDYRGESYATPFGIMIFTKDLWLKVKKEEGPKPNYIAENSKYVFTYYRWQDAPEDLISINFNVDKIISTFKFIK